MRHRHHMTGLLIAAGILAAAYGLLWLGSIRKYQTEFGVSFSADHARWLGLDWQKVYHDMFADLGTTHVRVPAQWNTVEKEKGQMRFTEIDWMMDEAEKQGAKVLLAVGQKTPRWPECHHPDWFDYTAVSAHDEFFSYVRAVVNRYRNHPALGAWQVENEPFINFRFGECAGFREDWVKEEINLARSLDPAHEIVVTDSGELGLWRKASRAGDVLGATLYRVVLTPPGWYMRYGWLPAGWYKARARLWGNDINHFMISELQAEPWFAGGTPMNTPVAEQEKSMDVGQLRANIDYARHVGASRAYLWGVEWWYFMKEKRGRGGYLEAVREEFSQSE